MVIEFSRIGESSATIMHPNRLRPRLTRDEVAVRILDRQVPGVKRFGALHDRNHLGPGAVGVQEPVAGAKMARVDQGFSSD
jgi:hypothetical protein